MDADTRELPQNIKSTLSPRNAQLNQLPIKNLLEIYRKGDAQVFIDRGLAVQAASSGVPTSGLTTLLSLMFPVLLISAPLAWYLFSWIYALAVVALAVAIFLTSRVLIVSQLRESALINPKLLEVMLSKGVIWFEYAEGQSNEIVSIGLRDTSNLTASLRKEAPLPPDKNFGGARTAPPYFNLPSDHDGWHDVLDEMVIRLKPIMSKFFPIETAAFVEAKCELLSYAAAYNAKLCSGSELPQVVWNTFVRSIENRIFGRIDVAPNLSGYRENADGSREFISYSSIYVAHMRDLEKVIDRHDDVADFDTIEILRVFSPKEEVLAGDAIAEFSQIFERAVLLCSDELIPTLEDFV